MQHFPSPTLANEFALPTQTPICAFSVHGNAGAFTTRSNHANLVNRLSRLAKHGSAGSNAGSINHHHHANTVVEGAVHLDIVNASRLLQPGKEFGLRPAAFFQMRCRSFGQYARNVLQQAAAGDMRQNIAGVRSCNATFPCIRAAKGR